MNLYVPFVKGIDIKQLDVKNFHSPWIINDECHIKCYVYVYNVRMEHCCQLARTIQCFEGTTVLCSRPVCFGEFAYFDTSSLDLPNIFGFYKRRAYQSMQYKLFFSIQWRYNPIWFLMKMGDLRGIWLVSYVPFMISWTWRHKMLLYNQGGTLGGTFWQ